MKFIIKLILCIYFFEKKALRKKIDYLKFLLANVHFFKYLQFLINKKKISPFKSKKFNLFLKNNLVNWSKINLNKFNSSNSIIVESFINHPGYTLSNAIISVFLKKIYNYNSIAIIRSSDIKSELIFRSFGIKNFIYFKDLNFFQRIYYLLKSFLFLKKFTNIDQVIKLKYKKVDLGLTAYDTYLRYVGDTTISKINPEFVVLFAESLFACDFFDRIIELNPSIKILVQSEIQFSPLNLLFQICLKNKIEIFSRYGGDKLTVRRYTDWKQRYSYRGAISQKLLDVVFKQNKSRAIEQFKLFYRKKIKSKLFGVDDVILGLKNPKVKNNNKDDVYKIFDWDKKKKIGVFFLSHLLDGNFNYGNRTNFRNIYYSTKFVLDLLPKLNKINWLIKKHPAEFHYYPKKDFSEELKYLINNYKHIKIFPNNINPSILLKIAKVAVTSSGTVGIEYPAFGINSIHFEKASYSTMNFTNLINSKKRLSKILKNSHNFKKINSDKSDKSKNFIFIREILIKNKCSLIPEHIDSRTLNENDFWEESVQLLKNFDFKNDFFFKMLKTQLKYNFRHTINLKKIKINLVSLNDFYD